VSVLNLENRVYRAVFQSFLAGATVFFALTALNISDYGIIIAAIGSSAFLVFALPSNPTSQPKNLIVGHTLGILSGFLAAFIPYQLLSFSTAVGLSILLMILTESEHPPASGTALGVALEGLSLPVAIFVIGGCFVLSAAHEALKPWLRDI
jgi:CBS domain-containing membrane protein